MISGTGAQMQSATYLPGYYHVVDQNVGGSGSLWQVLSNGTTCKIGRVYNVLPEASGSDPCLSYNKEILRHTMLKHEAIFRNQVNELHRLYWRQRELMNEISRNYLKFQTSQSNLIPSEMQLNIFQKALEIPCPLPIGPGDVKPTAQGGENLQMPSTFVSQKSAEAGSRIYLKETALEEQRVSSSKSHYSRKRLLDLELPAQDYIDSEDEEGLGASNTAQVKYESSESASLSPTKSNLKLNDASSSNGSSNCAKTKFLFDLNEPIQLDESETPNSANFIDSVREIMLQDQDSFGKSKSELLVQNEESTYDVLEGKGNEGSSLISRSQDSSAAGSLLCGDRTSLCSEGTKKKNEMFDDNNLSMLSSCITNSCTPLLISDEAKTEASTSVSSQKTSPHTLKDIPVAIQALPCFNNPELLTKTSGSSISTSGIKRKHCNSKRNPACSPSLGSGSCCITGNSDNEHAAEHSSPAECIRDSNHAKLSEDMDANVMPHSSLPALVFEGKDRRTYGASTSKNSGQLNRPTVNPDYDGTDMETPVSPENKEHYLPRGDSEENQIEIPSHISKQKSRDPNEDFNMIAAEIIVSISSLGVQRSLKNDKSGPLDVSGDCLSWFAGIVSSVTVDQGIEIGHLLNDSSSSAHNVLATGEIEHIEATVFKLTGIKVEDHCPQTSNQKSKTIAGTVLPSHQSEKGQTRNTRQRKGFLSGPLCIASVPSSDVTENFQPTEQLINATGSTSGSSTGERHIGRNGRGRRRNSKMVSSKMERSVCSLLNQHTSENELSLTLRSLLGWGRKHRRQKSRQVRANYCPPFD